MNENIEIHWTSGSLDELRKICRYLVQERLVASAQIIPWIESIFLLNNHLETLQESKAILKTKRKHYEKIQEIISKNSHYDIPEITCFVVDLVNPIYKAWIDESILEY